MMDNIVLEENLKAAVENNRADIVRAVLSSLQESNENSEAVKSLLSNNISNCGSLLHLAVKLRQTDIVRILVDSGAPLSLKNDDGLAPLDLLSDNDSMKEVFNHELFQAASHSNVSRIKELLVAGIKLDIVDSPQTQNTALHWASTYGNSEVVHFLCQNGSDVNALNALGMPPLFDAVRRGGSSVVQELLLHGADPHYKFIDRYGLEVSVESLVVGNEKLLELIQNTSANPSHEQLVDLSLTPDPLYVPNGGVVRDHSSPCPSPPPPSGLSPRVLTPDLPPSVLPPDLLLNVLPSRDRSFQLEERVSLLFPPPQDVVHKPGSHFSISDQLNIYIIPGPTCSLVDVTNVWHMRKNQFQELGIAINTSVLSSQTDTDQPHVMCHVNSRLCHSPGAYKITTYQYHIKVLSCDKQGLIHAISTLLQLFKLYHKTTGCVLQLQIDDWPDYKIRGCLFVLSQGRIHTLESIKFKIDQLSLMKLNQIHLFFKFCDSKWSLPYKTWELLEFSTYCSERCIELIPVLEVGSNIHLENVPELYEIWQDYLSCFPDYRYVSIGPRLSSLLLYVNYEDDFISFTDVYRYLPITNSSTLMFCAYPLLDISNDALRSMLPTFVFMIYGTKGNPDFRTLTEKLTDARLPFCCCPDTAAWNSLAGCPEAAQMSVERAAESMSNLDCLGTVICNWSAFSSSSLVTNYDFISWPGYLRNAALSWNINTEIELTQEYLSVILSTHIFDDDKLVIGDVVMDLGRHETWVQEVASNKTGIIGHLPDSRGSVLLQLLINPDDVQLKRFTCETFQSLMKNIKKCKKKLSHCDITSSYGNGVVDEVTLTIELMLYACKVGRTLASVGKNPNCDTGYKIINPGTSNLPPTTRTDLANKLLELVPLYSDVWSRHFTQDGLQEALSDLQTSLQYLVPSDSLVAAV